MIIEQRTKQENHQPAITEELNEWLSQAQITNQSLIMKQYEAAAETLCS